jgi:zinc transport system substrate-binding protein
MISGGKRTVIGGLAGALAVVLLVVASGCGSGSSGGDPLRVVASFYPLAETVQRIGGDAVEVTNLTPPGSEPHDLELTSRQVDAIEDADLVVYLGGGFQPAVEQAVEGSARRAVDIGDAVGLEASDQDPDHPPPSAGGQPPAGSHDADRGAGGDEPALDPHFWLDPTRLAEAVSIIEAAMIEARPDDTDVFRSGAEEFRATLTSLDDEFVAGLRSCERRDLVTTHAAFHYLARRYGLTQLPIAGLEPEAEPSPGRLAELADLIRERGVTTVFYETLVPRDLADTLARETGAQAAVLDPIEGLSDRAIADGASYLTVMRDNLEALRTALDCR